MKFGVSIRGRLTGADLAVRIVQIAAALPLLYVTIVSGWLSLATRKTVLSYLFSLGVCTIPRPVALGAAALYRHAGGEVLFSMVLVAAALLYGLWMNRLLRSNHGRRVRVILAVLIGLDLIARFLPLGFLGAFGLSAELPAFLLRAGCLVLILLDLRAEKTAENSRPAPTNSGT